MGREVQGFWEGTTKVVAEEAGLDADMTPTRPMSHIPIFGLGSA